jgi:hypothetical protein
VYQPDGDMADTIRSLLQQFGVPYVERGKNTGPACLGLKCPYCGDDPSEHCGVFKDNGVFTCFRCGQKGSFAYLLSTLSGLSTAECASMIKGETYSPEKIREKLIDRLTLDKTKAALDRQAALRTIEEIPLPDCYAPISITTRLPLLDKWLKRRHVALETVVKHRCGYCLGGRYSHRLIVPMLFHGCRVGFVALDLTGKADRKALNDDFGQIGEYLYGYDEVRPSSVLVVVEGILDQWRVGHHCVATLGTHITDGQREMILGLHPRPLVICRDGDYYWRSRKTVHEFQPFVQTKVVMLPKTEDPDSIGHPGVVSCIKQALSSNVLGVK